MDPMDESCALDRFLGEGSFLANNVSVGLDSLALGIEGGERELFFTITFCFSGGDFDSLAESPKTIDETPPGGIPDRRPSIF